MTAVSISPSKRLHEIPKVIVTDPPQTLKLEADSMNFVFVRPITVSQFLQVCIVEYKFSIVPTLVNGY